MLASTSNNEELGHVTSKRRMCNISFSSFVFGTVDFFFHLMQTNLDAATFDKVR